MSVNRFINGALQRIAGAVGDAVPVINNLLTNVAGSALDAMQGKILNDKITAIATAIEEIKSILSGLWNYETYNATDISVEIGKSWTEVISYVPTTGNGRYLVIVQITVPTLSEDAMVTVSSNAAVQYSNATAILANKVVMRLQSVGFLLVNDNTPIKVNAFSSLPFTCTDARIVCMKIK